MRIVILVLLFVAATNAQERYRLCAPKTISDNTCYALQRGESQVSCFRVEDSAECAIRLNRGEADFGVFTAEELLLAYQFYPTGIQLISQLKHKDKATELFEFQSVVVVSSTYRESDGYLGDLKNAGFCHPGFSKSQIWNDNILKHFEKKVINSTYGYSCLNDLTVAENEAKKLQELFGSACRPGDWVSDSTVDQTLKKKYPELCSLCDDTSTCKYANGDNHGHTGALQCLTSGRGKVAYVALDYVREYFKLNETFPSSSVRNYQFLCPDGSVQSLTTTRPCAWIKQSWSAIAARDDRAAQLTEGLKVWLTSSARAEDWTVALKSILQQDVIAEYFTKVTTPAEYLSRGRDVELTNSSCGNTIRWCTINEMETNKCNWVAKAALTHGIEPPISCNQANSTFHCFHDIAENKADIITIDSNYGHIVRQTYNLSTVLFTETDNDRSSIVIAVVRDGANYNVSSFAALKDRTACFPEYGGIAWLSFVNVARTNGIISDSCDYPAIVANFLSGACTPGFHDSDHSNDTSPSNIISTLCSLCPLENNNATCSANISNIYYGDRGALECLDSGAGDVAFIEAKNLNAYVESGLIDANQYRVLCKNSSLALYTGFNIDDLCALSVTIDSEVVGRKNNSAIDITDTTLALLKIEDWLGYRTNSLRPIHVYGPFNGTIDLLFKDSTSGLESISSTIKSVLSYKELFSHVEICSSANSIFSYSITLLVTLFSLRVL